MMPIEAYKHFGLGATVLIFLGLIFVITRWPQGRHMTFSRHVAQHRSAIIYYFLLFTATLPLLLAFFLLWFIPTFHLSYFFTSCIVAAILFQYSVTIVPETGGWKSACHITGATLAGIFMMLAILQLLFVDTTTPNKLITFTCLTAMVWIFLVGLKNKIEHSHLLILQSGFYIAFFIAILSLTYSS